MKTATIRELRRDTMAVLAWVKNGETVAVTRRDERVAILSAPGRKRRIVRPDFAARLKRIYGDRTLEVTATEGNAEGRGET